MVRRLVPISFSNLARRGTGSIARSRLIDLTQSQITSESKHNLATHIPQCSSYLRLICVHKWCFNLRCAVFVWCLRGNRLWLQIIDHFSEKFYYFQCGGSKRIYWVKFEWIFSLIKLKVSELWLKLREMIMCFISYKNMLLMIIRSKIIVFCYCKFHNRKYNFIV